MGSERRFTRVAGAWTRIVARFRPQRGLGSLEQYQCEIRRLEGELKTVRARREKERAEFRARHRILDQYSPDQAMPLAEVDRQLANLRRIREDRLQAEERAYEQQIHELERQIQERFGPR